MAPLVLEGATLGKRHQHYNQLLKDVTISKADPDKIDYNKTDIENLFNIDVASNNRDLEYILDVFEGEDILYVSRAIKRSAWLITDAQYAHIVDPEYLHSQLFPQMMPKASGKLLLHIRLTLRDESRVEKFFQFFREKDVKTAMKWLPYCSIPFIEDAVEKHSKKISLDILARLCRRSPTILVKYIKALKGSFYNLEYLGATMFVLNCHTELYLDVLEIEEYSRPHLTKKQTQIVMTKCSERIINNFEKYRNCIHLDTFAKYLKKEHIKSFVLTQLENKIMESWFNQDKITKFMKYMPKEDRSELIKLCINKAILSDSNDTNDDWVSFECAMSLPVGGGGGAPKACLKWYKHAQFEVAFPELKKLIRAESNPDERNAMLMILNGTTRKNLGHIHTLLQYYKERHINEPFRFKVQFINDLLHKTDPHLYDDKIWNIMDELFRSMEVYIESENNVQTCIKAIIAYKVVHDEAVDDIIENKFHFDFLRRYERKLKGVQRDKLFTYLYHMFLNKLEDHIITHQAEFEKYVEFLKIGLDLLNIWKKELINHPVLINKIKVCVKIKKETKWSTSLASLHNIKPSWKKLLFEESLVLSPSEMVCMNALKHDPELLDRHQYEIDTLRYNDAVYMEKLLRKLRVYWPQTIASNWTAAYRERIDRPGGQKALIRGLFCLLNQHELIEFLDKYKPQETKISWVDADELQLSLRKNIAQNMHVARPQISPDTVFWYAKGDYVQFTRPALNSILYNLRPSHSRDCALKLLNGTVSLQKCGIHLAFAKLSTAEMKKLFEDVWKTTKNSCVRAVLCQNINDILCKKRDEVLISEAWGLLQTFIDSLSAEENKVIYNTFSKLLVVPDSIKPAYCIKRYKFLKSLSSKVDGKTIRKMKEEMNNIIEKLDSGFIASIIEEFTNEVIIKKRRDYSDNQDLKLLTSFLLCAETESDQTERFNKVFLPVMDKSLASWDKTDNNKYLIVKQNFTEIIEQLISSTDYVFFKNKAKPVSLYQNILMKLESTLPVTQNFVLFRQLKLAAAIIDILDNKKSDTISITKQSELQDLYSVCVPDITEIIIRYLKEDVNEYGSFVYRPFHKAVSRIFDLMRITGSTQCSCMKHMLIEKNVIPTYLLVIRMLTSYCEDKNKQILKEICATVLSHPSPEVQINYYMKFGDRPLLGDD